MFTDSADPGAYWRKLNERLKKEVNKTVAAEGKIRLTDVACTARKATEKGLGRSIVSQENYLPKPLPPKREMNENRHPARNIGKRSGRGANRGRDRARYPGTAGGREGR